LRLELLATRIAYKSPLPSSRARWVSDSRPVLVSPAGADRASSGLNRPG
jgi:hypothetical protein